MKLTTPSTAGAHTWPIQGARKNPSCWRWRSRSVPHCSVSLRSTICVRITGYPGQQRIDTGVTSPRRCTAVRMQQVLRRRPTPAQLEALEQYALAHGMETSRFCRCRGCSRRRDRWSGETSAGGQVTPAGVGDLSSARTTTNCGRLCKIQLKSHAIMTIVSCALHATMRSWSTFSVPFQPVGMT